MSEKETQYCQISTCQTEAVTERTDEGSGLVYKLCSQCASVWDLAQSCVEIAVEIVNGVAYCDDPRVDIVDHDDKRR